MESKGKQFINQSVRIKTGLTKRGILRLISDAIVVDEEKEFI